MDQYKSRRVRFTGPSRQMALSGQWLNYNGTILESTEYMYSQWHRFRRKDLGDGDMGGEFFHFKNYFQTNTPFVSVWGPRSGTIYRHEGPLFAVPSLASVFTPLGSPSRAYLNGLGATAIARSLPTNPSFDAATFIGELHEGLPRAMGVSLWRDRALRARSAGGEYLNVEFGWKPLVNDLQKFARAVKTSHKVLTQYSRDSGRKVRRRYYFPSELTRSETNDVQQVFPAVDVGIWFNQSTSFPRTTIQTTQVDTWFSGAFTYYLNVGSSAADRMDRHLAEANKLLGIRLTPDVLWELAPWSWAADWVGNVGDIAHNVSAFASDGLTMPYAYLMQRKTVENVHTMYGVRAKNGFGPANVVSIFGSETQSRIAASPFGFGLKFDTLSGRQQAIIGALGLSRAPRPTLKRLT